MRTFFASRPAGIKIAPSVCGAPAVATCPAPRGALSLHRDFDRGGAHPLSAAMDVEAVLFHLRALPLLEAAGYLIAVGALHSFMASRPPLQIPRMLRMRPLIPRQSPRAAAVPIDTPPIDSRDRSCGVQCAAGADSTPRSALPQPCARRLRHSHLDRRTRLAGRCECIRRVCALRRGRRRGVGHRPG
jgi:hypothetical protein